MSDRGNLTFSEGAGYADVPRQLRLEELPAPARVGIWNALYVHLDQTKRLGYLDYFIGEPWQTILRSLYIWHDVKPLDEWTDRFDVWCERLRRRVQRDSFNRVFDLIQFIMQHEDCPQTFLTTMGIVFRSSHLAYEIHAGPPPAILQATTRAEGYQLRRSLDDLHAAGLNGCATHIRSASQHINEGDWASSIRESIHAVESVARQIDPGEAKTLGAALNALEKRGMLQHKALKDAFSKLYGYTSDEHGIRHALLLEGEANVTADEALLMLGACASFASYLWRKHQAANAQ